MCVASRERMDIRSCLISPVFHFSTAQYGVSRYFEKISSCEANPMVIRLRKSRIFLPVLLAPGWQRERERDSSRKWQLSRPRRLQQSVLISHDGLHPVFSRQAGGLCPLIGQRDANTSRFRWALGLSVTSFSLFGRGAFTPDKQLGTLFDVVWFSGTSNYIRKPNRTSIDLLPVDF